MNLYAISLPINAWKAINKHLRGEALEPAEKELVIEAYYEIEREMAGAAVEYL